MSASSAWRGRLLCAALLALAAALPRCAGAATFQRDSRFRLPSSPDTSAWLSPPEIIAEPFAAAPIQGFVKASVAIYCVRALRHLLTTCSNNTCGLQAVGTNLVVDGRISFFAGSNNFFLALRHYHIPIMRSLFRHSGTPLATELYSVPKLVYSWQGLHN